MVCRTVAIPGGGYAIVKMAAARRRRCQFVGDYGRLHCKKTGTLQCDWPKPGGGTCDAYMCAEHSRQDGPKDYCLLHVDAPTGLPRPAEEQHPENCPCCGNPL